MRLLLADDSVTIQRVIELTFADEGIDVVSVGDGQQAIDRLGTERFDVVLADVGMPGVDGFAVATYVQSRPELANLPVVLLTGAFDAVDQQRVAAVRAAGVLAKPFEPQMVIAKVREVLGGPAAPAPAAPPAAAPPGSADDYFERLDRAFAEGNIDEQKLKDLTLHIGNLQAELRYTHLRAHLLTREVLTPEQIRKYNEFRGYRQAPQKDPR